MTKYHISHDGKVRECSAKRRCRLGGSFGSPEEAERFSVDLNEQSLPSGTKKLKSIGVEVITDHPMSPKPFSAGHSSTVSVIASNDAVDAELLAAIRSGKIRAVGS